MIQPDFVCSDTDQCRIHDFSPGRGREGWVISSEGRGRRLLNPYIAHYMKMGITTVTPL